MLARIISLILVLAVTAISLGSLVAAPLKDEMSCCVSENPAQSCPDCPMAADNDHKCCCVTALLLYFTRSQPLIHSFSMDHYVVRPDFYISQTTRPLLRPPKIS